MSFNVSVILQPQGRQSAQPAKCRFRQESKRCWMLIREFLQGSDPIFRQIEASGRSAGWVLLLDVNEDA